MTHSGVIVCHQSVRCNSNITTQGTLNALATRIVLAFEKTVHTTKTLTSILEDLIADITGVLEGMLGVLHGLRRFLQVQSGAFHMGQPAQGSQDGRAPQANLEGMEGAWYIL